MSKIQHIRIDDRLIHGQVANVWCTGLGIDRIIVPNDAVAENEVQKSALRMSTPKGINTSLISVQKTIDNLLADKYGDQKLLIIVNNPADIKRLIDGGIAITSFNIGNMSKRENATQITKSVSITPEEEKCISKMIKRGVKVTAQMLPDSKLYMVEDLLTEKK